MITAALLAGMTLTMAACGSSYQAPVTEETLPLPLWAHEEKQSPELTEAPTEQTETESVSETISQRIEETLPPAETASQEETMSENETEEASETETAETEAPAASQYDMEEKFQAVPAETVYSRKSVNIRAQANVDSQVLSRLEEGKTVTRVGISSDGWSAVVHEDVLCYIASEYLTTQEVAEKPENPNVPTEKEVDDMVYTVDDVNMREGPGFDRAVLCRVPEFVELHRTGIVSSGWCRVTYKDKEGFISTGYLAEKHPGQLESQQFEEDPVDDVVYTTREVNFRSGPDTKRAIIGRIPEGTELKRIAVTDNGWGKITYEGQDGYVSGDYLSTEKSDS